MKTKVRYVLGAVVLSASLIAGSSAIRSVAADQPTSSTPAPVPVANQSGTSIDSSARTEEAARMFGTDRVGIPWVSKDQQTLYIGVKNLSTDEKSRWSKTDTQLVATKYSHADLNRMQDRLRAALGNDVGSGISAEGEGASAQVVLIVRGNFTSAQQEQVKAIVPVEILRLSPKDTDAQLAVNRNPAFPPWMGGHWGTYSYTEECTSGLELAGGFGPMGTTAGHCPPDGSQNAWVWVMGNNGWIVSNQAMNKFYGNPNNEVWVDTSLYSLNGTLALPAIKVSDSLNRSISGRYNDSAPIGQQLCFSGLGSNVTKCGVQIVIDDSVSFLWHGQYYNLVHHDCMSAGGINGDSGAPVYALVGTDRAKAAGTASYLRPTVSQTCYSKIQLIVFFTGNDIVHV